MRRRRHPTGSRGLTLVETVVASSLIAAILGGAISLLDATQDLAESATNQRTAARRVDRALSRMAQELRRGSLATVRQLDDSSFADAETDVGFSMQPVVGWDGAAVLGDRITYEFDATTGEIVRSDGVIETVLSRGLTGFSVQRTGNLFTFTTQTSAGPADDRSRTASGALSVVARNP